MDSHPKEKNSAFLLFAILCATAVTCFCALSGAASRGLLPVHASISPTFQTPSKIEVPAENPINGRNASTKLISHQRPNPPAPIRNARDFRIHGTGFFVTKQGHLITCWHILKGAKSYQVGVGGKRLNAGLISYDAENDLALLKVEGKFSSMSIDPTPGRRLGEGVFTLGFPNSELQGVQPKLTEGIINSLSGFKDNPREYQVSVSVQPGSSGGPLFDASGRVVGVVTSRLDDYAILKSTGYLPQNVNYALKSSVVLEFLQRDPEILRLVNAAKSPVSSGDPVEVFEHVRDAIAYVIVTP